MEIKRMTKAEFIEELEMILNEDVNSVSESSVLAEIACYDSTGMLGVIALLDEIGAKVDVDAIRSCKTVGDLMALEQLSLD
jgi:hypothetical protein